IISSGAFTYGTIFCVGSLVQALSPARAAEAAASFSTSRRFRPSGSFAGSCGNSFSRNSRYSLVSDNSSRLCQKRLPSSCASFARSAARSIACGTFGLRSELIVFFFSPSAVTGRTICQTMNFVLFHQSCTEFQLIRRRHVARIEYLGFFAHIFFRCAMAIQAPLHVQRVGFPRQRHLRYLSVASG